MNRLWIAFQQTSILFKLGFVVVVVVVLALVSGSVGGFVSHLKDKAFDKQITALKAERMELQAKADAAEERAKAAEADKAKFQIAFELAGARAQAAVDKVNDAEKKYNEDLQSIDAPVDDCTRYNRIRAKLNLAPVPCTAEESNR